MIVLFIILFVLPVIAVISLIIAVVWGIKKAENIKRYFIILGCIVAGIAFFVSTAFIDYKSAIVNTFTSNDVPVEYQDYHYLSDTITSDYSIIKLQDETINEIFTDLLTGNIIIVTHNENLDMKKSYHRIDSTGQLLGSFTTPNDVFQRGRYFIGEKSYCEWITTGDTTYNAYTPIVGVMNRETLKPWYEGADYAELFYYGICILHKDGVWYRGKFDFKRDEIAHNDKYPPKIDYALAHLADVDVNVQTMNDLNNDWSSNTYLTFNHCPSSINDGTFLFEYFYKEEYYSGFSSMFSGIGSPTGGGNHSARWYGTAYCKLRIGNTYIPFAYGIMTYEDTHGESYQMKLSMYVGSRCAIISNRYSTYIISTSK